MAKNNCTVRPAAATWLALVIAAAVGCGSELGAEVEGTVTLDGEPVGPGMVLFAPVDKARNPADGAIMPDGSYFLRTSRTVGLKPGKYRASATVLDQPKLKEGERSNEPAKLVTPAKYGDPSTSGLEFEVKSGKQTIDIVLSSK